MKSKSEIQTTNSTQLPQFEPNQRFRTPYGPRLSVSLLFQGDGKTQQQFKDECDINNIMKAYSVTGLFTHVNTNEPRYLDATGYDYQAAMNLVAEAQGLFAQLPSDVRYEFENNPQKFLEFCENPANAPRLAEMGLATLRPQNQGGDINSSLSSQPTPPVANPSAS